MRDGYKRHVLTDVDTALSPAGGISPANVPKAQVSDAIAADLAAQGRRLVEWHIDRVYLSSVLVWDRDEHLEIFCKAWRVQGAGGRFAKTAFLLDCDPGVMRCPAGPQVSFEVGKMVHCPQQSGAACPLRTGCTTSRTGCSVTVHPAEELLSELCRP